MAVVLEGTFTEELSFTRKDGRTFIVEAKPTQKKGGEEGEIQWVGYIAEDTNPEHKLHKLYGEDSEDCIDKGLAWAKGYER